MGPVNSVWTVTLSPKAETHAGKKKNSENADASSSGSKHILRNLIKKIIIWQVTLLSIEQGCWNLLITVSMKIGLEMLNTNEDYEYLQLMMRGYQSICFMAVQKKLSNSSKAAKSRQREECCSSWRLLKGEQED